MSKPPVHQLYTAYIQGNKRNNAPDFWGMIPSTMGDVVKHLPSIKKTYGEPSENLEQLKKANTKAVFYGEKELGGLHVMYVLDDSPQVYGLPVDPELPAAATVRDVFKWLGVGAVAAVALGFGLNYVIARKAIISNERAEKKE